MSDERPLDSKSDNSESQSPEKKPTAAQVETATPVEEKPPWLVNPATPEWQDAEDDPLIADIRSTHGDAVQQARSFAGDLVLEVAVGQVADLCSSMKQQGFVMLVDLCGVDYPDRDIRFEVVYHLYSFELNRRIQLKVKVGEGNEVPTVSGVWRAANWMEREAFDMYGIRFTGHPDMTRILTWEGFNGHPLRKDFPVEGIDTGAAAYPEYYQDEAGPVAGTGTGWKPPQPPEPEVSGSDAPADESTEGTES